MSPSGKYQKNKDDENDELRDLHEGEDNRDMYRHLRQTLPLSPPIVINKKGEPEYGEHDDIPTSPMTPRYGS